MIARGAEDRSQESEGRCLILDSGCLILEKSFTAENAEKRAKSTDFEGKLAFLAGVGMVLLSST